MSAEPIALSILETRKALGGEGDPLSPQTIYRLIGRGELEAFKIGTRTMITWASVKRLVANAPRELGPGMSGPSKHVGCKSLAEFREEIIYNHQKL